MNQSCKNCGLPFPVTKDDQTFCEKLEVPEPTICPYCREKSRLAWRNERNMYRSKCARTGKPIISYISPDKDQVVYSLEEWFKDDWDRLEHGRDFDFSKPFFEQFASLLKVTPHIPLLIGECENCEYTNFSWKNKNCYLVSASDFNEDCMYLSYGFRCRDCFDCMFVSDSELLYECTDCERCYGSDNLKQCKDTRDSSYCEDCVGCMDCIGCVNLRKQQYYIFNKRYKKEDYEMKRHALSRKPEEIEKGFAELRMKEPIRAFHISKSENCIGNNILNSKNCYYCFDVVECEDLRYVTYGEKSKDCMDINGAPHCELTANSVASPESYGNRFCSSCWIKPNSYLTYCHLCRACSQCFGCVSLHQNKFCILNKQYTEEEYKKLVPRIIEHMNKTGEWGQFFPSEISPWAYNETVAQDYYPLTKD